MKTHRLKKSLQVFRHILKMYRRKKKKLPEKVRGDIASSLRTLQDHLIEKNREGADKQAKQAENLYTLHLKKSPFERGRDFIIGLAVALFVAPPNFRRQASEQIRAPCGQSRHPRTKPPSCPCRSNLRTWDTDP